MKGDVAGRLRVSAAAYHYDYKDLQVTAFTVVNGASISNLQNAGSVKINGFEANLTAQITPNLTLDASASIIDTEIHDFPNATVQVPIGGASGNRTISADVSGNKLIRTPDYTFSLGATYRRPLFGGDLTLNVTAFFSDAYYAELLNRVKQPKYEVVNASATWRSPKGYYVTVFGQNLTNQNYAVGQLISSFIDGAQANKPRWFGVTVGYGF